MTGKVTVQTPVLNSDAIELGRTTWRKQILPIGQLPYKGRTLDFTRDYINNLVAAYKDRAFDAVPFQLAPDDNSHSNAVDRAAGEIIGLEALDDGLYATVSASDRGAEILREHPNLGVSVRVVEDYQRNDGKTSRSYPAALQHVLATWAPRIAGMKPWQAIDCAEETDEVIDLSALTFTPDGDANKDSETPAVPGGETQKGAPVAQLTEEELAAVRAIYPVFKKLAEDDEPTPPTANTEAAPQPPVFVEAPVVEEPVVEVVDEEPVLVAASEEDAPAIDLAQVEMATKLDKQAIELAELKAERDEERWTVEAAELVRDYGIPPVIVALCEPLLRGSKHVVELSDGSVDAGKVLRDVLHNVAKTYGRRVDLSGPIGSSVELAAADAEKAERDAFLSSQRAAGFGK
jgi:hypothetical protein